MGWRPLRPPARSSREVAPLARREGAGAGGLEGRRLIPGHSASPLGSIHYSSSCGGRAHLPRRDRAAASAAGARGGAGRLPGPGASWGRLAGAEPPARDWGRRLAPRPPGPPAPREDKALPWVDLQGQVPFP